jgi:hypothetical protein
MRKSHAHILWMTSISAVLLMAADANWKNKPAAQWSEEEAKQVLTDSPWVKVIHAAISRRLSEDELREGGQMGQPHGVGYDGIDLPGTGPKFPTNPMDIFLPGNDRSIRSGIQPIDLKLSWESALPVRLAELKSHEIEPPTMEGDGYRIAVYGVRGGNFKGDPKKLGDPLKKDAFLKRQGKKDVKPSMVEVFQPPSGLVVVYTFPLSAEITKRDGYVLFEAHIGRVVVSHSFTLAEMQFLGNLEL